MNKPLFQAENLNFKINSTTLLKNMNFVTFRGKVTAIIGPSGSGKSTLLKLLNHLFSPSSGKLFYKNKDIFHWSPRELRREVVYVSQHPYLFSGTVRSNLEYMGPVDHKRQAEILKQVHLAGDYLERDVRELSSGEAQRVNIARAILREPEVFLFDEPTSNLDMANQRIIEELITERLLNKATVIMISHDFAQIKRIAQEVIMLSDGKIVDQLELPELMKKYSEQQIAEFFEDNADG